MHESARAQTEPFEPHAGAKIASRYVLVEELARGGMGTVWLADDAKLRRSVAVKVLTADFADNDSSRRRFAREAMAVAQLQCPNGDEEIAKVLDFSVAKTKESPAAAQMPRALVGKSLQRVDVGEERRTKAGTILGTPHFMAPEQARGHVALDHRADLWSLGIIAYRMITGKLPYRSSAAARSPRPASTASTASPTSPRAPPPTTSPSSARCPPPTPPLPAPVGPPLRRSLRRLRRPRETPDRRAPRPLPRYAAHRGPPSPMRRAHHAPQSDRRSPRDNGHHSRANRRPRNARPHDAQTEAALPPRVPRPAPSKAKPQPPKPAGGDPFAERL